MSTPLQRLRCQYDGDFYLMDLSRDRFVHFTTRGRAAEIMESGRLLMRPPYKKFGIDAVAAVSTVWGSFLPGVQTTHIDADKRDLVGVVFQTKVMPEVGYPEEVLWKQDVVLVNPKVVPYAQAKGMIRGSSDFDGQVYYAVPSWCDGVEGRVASLSGFMSEYQRDTAEPENPRSRHHRVWWDEHYECAIHTEIVDQKGRAYLKIIQIEDPDCKGRGRAADVMKRLVRMADRHKIEMSLSPEAVGGKHISTSGLSRWYKRLGFHPRGMFEAWVREPGGMPPVDDAKWEVLIERPSGDEVFDYYAESFDEARDHAYTLSIDPTFLKDGEATAFRRDGGRWRKIASASRVASRVASRYTPAESAAISLLQDAPDESVEDLIEQVLRARRLFDPVSRTFVDAKEVAEALRGMAPEPYKVPGGVSVYHATDASTARLLTRRGFIPQTKPRNLTDTYAPGRGIDRGLYVGATPRSVEGYGRVTLEVTVPRKHLSVPTELTQLGETSPMKALKSHDGAVINHPIPADAFRAVRGRLASNTRVARVSPRIKEAIEESMANLPDRLRQAVDIFSAGVIMGKAPSLEQHTSALYKAFAPLRDALGGTTTVYRGQPINPPKIERTWLSWTTEPRMAARFTGNRGYQIIEAKVKSSDVVAGILSPRNPNYIEFLVKNRPEYQTRSQKQVPIYYALDMPLNPRFYDDMPENFSDLSDREQLEFSYPGWKRWLKDNGKAVERAGGLVMHNDPPTMNPDEKGPFLGVLMPADVELPPALAALDDAKYGRPMPRYMGKVAGLSPLAYKYIVLDAHAELNPHVSDWVFSGNKAAKKALFRAYEGLDDNEKDALDHEVRGVMPSSLTVYRSVRPGQPLDRGGSSVTDDPSTRTGEVHAWRITPADVLLHYGQKESWLASKAYGHEREIILKPNAKPKYLGPVEQKNASAARVASRYMQAGLLDVPPKVVEDVYQWCMERLCSEWLEHQLPYKREQIRRELEGADGWQRDFQEKRLVNLGLVEREAKKWGRAGTSFSGQQGDTWLGYIDADFSGWRYASEIRRRTGKTPNELAKEMGKDRFFLTLRNNEKLDGTWTPSTTTRGWAMEIKINFDPHDLKTWRSRTQELRKVIAHETGHLTQSYLDLLLNLGTPGEDVPTSGLPASGLAEPGFDPLGNKLSLYGNPIAEMHGREDHALREVEFYTRLRDDVDDFVRMTKRIPKDAWREALRVWVTADERSYSDPLRFQIPGEMSRDVRNSDFFKTIKQNRGKWQKAVSLFVDEVGKRISIPSAVRVASAPTRVASRYAATTPLPPSFPKTEIGLMTMDEFLEYRNPQGKFHEAETWDYDVMRMNRPTESRLGEAMGYTFDQMRGGIRVTEKDSHSAGVPTLAGVIHNGTLYYSNAREGRNIPDFYFGIRADKKGEIEIRNRKQVKYLSEVLPRISPVAKRNVQKYPVILQRLIVKGEPMTLRAESQPGSMAEASTLVILNSEDLVVAQASDEWGATLIAVAREYRGRGLGKIIGKRWYELNPSNTSGGFTSAGQENALALWRDRVREFKARGWYSEMIREGRITMDRLKDIFKGVEDSKRDLEEFKALYFSEREPEPTKPTGDILVWSDGDSAVIVYDRAFLEDPDDRFIYGHGFLRSSPHTGTYIFSIDYDRPYAEMTTKALMQVARDGGDDRLYDGEGYSDIVEAENFPGVERDGDYLVLTRDLFPLRQEARKEKRLRKSVDPYDEKVYLLQEQADSKWR